MDKKALEHYITGKATLEERMEVVEWMDSNEENVREYMALHKLHDIAVMNQIQTEEKQKTSEIHKYVLQPKWKKLSIELLKIAAVAIILLGINALLNKNTDTSYQTIYVPIGQRAEIILPDSTKVWLNSNTLLKYPLAFNKQERRIQLDGEAYVSVTHNKKPFIVETENFDVNVLGTEFNIKAYKASAQKQVDLLKGSIEMTGTLFANRKLLVKPEESIHIDGNNIKVSHIAEYDYFKWKEGLICFTDESFEEIIRKLELYYDTRIKVENKDLLQEHYSGKFRTKDGIEQVFDVLQLELKFTYVKDDNLNLITIK